MVNVNLLKGKIIEKGYSVENIAKQAGVDKSTLYRKLSTKDGLFTIREADAIVKILSLSKDEASAIFFNQFVAYSATRQ